MKKSVYDFLKSDLKEADFYGLSKDDLIDLKDYLDLLSQKEAECKELIEPQVASIKNKLDWVSNVSFRGAKYGSIELPSIWLLAKDGAYLIVVLDPKTGEYIDKSKPLPIVTLISRSARDREKRKFDLINIQKELSQITETAFNVYNGLYNKTSVSGDFQIRYIPETGACIYSRDESLMQTDIIASYDIYGDEHGEKPYLTGEAKEKVLTRIQIKK